MNNYDLSDCKTIKDVCIKYVGTVTDSNKNKAKKIIESCGYSSYSDWLNKIKEEDFQKEFDYINSLNWEELPQIAKDIYTLRFQKKSYKEISKKLNCNKSIVCYWCNPSQKTKIKEREKKIPWRRTLIKRIGHFKERKNTINDSIIENGIPYISISDWEKALRDRIRKFKYRSNEGMRDWNINDVITKFGMTPKCGLTGKQLNLEDPDSYVLDHILPVCKGGTNDLDNLQIVDPVANQCKTFMTMEELLDMCESILRYHNKIE